LSSNGDKMNFRHIGVACRDITAGLESIRRIYDVAHESPIIYDDNRSPWLCLAKVNCGPMIERSKPAPLFDNRPVAFLLSLTGMIELLESET
jgi:hypothetical protein